MQTSQRAVLLIVLALVAACCVHGASMFRKQRAVTSPATDMGIVKLCHSSTPCGWAVYIPFTRRIEYFMKNTCDCPKEKVCVQSDDDLSVSAYVYRCHVETQAEESETETGS